MIETGDAGTENKCRAGYKCEAGSRSKFSEPCPPGTYQPSDGMDSCIACDPGFYCLGTTVNPIPCPAGYYCEEGDENDPLAVVNFPQPCPKGYYGASVGLTNINECTLCERGFYCAETGADSPTGMCDAGYYCEAGSAIPR